MWPSYSVAWQFCQMRNPSSLDPNFINKFNYSNTYRSSWNIILNLWWKVQRTVPLSVDFIWSSDDISLVQCTYSTVQYSTVQHCTVQYSSVQYSTVQYSTVHYSTVQYSTVQYSTVQYSPVQYSIVPVSSYSISFVIQPQTLPGVIFRLFWSYVEQKILPHATNNCFLIPGALWFSNSTIFVDSFNHIVN